MTRKISTIRRRWGWLIVGVIAVALIVINYFRMLSFSYYIDEEVYARLAYGLAQGHLASSSSYYQLYAELGFNRSDIFTPFGHTQTVEPWLDHPPLIPIMMVPIVILGLSPRLLPTILSCLTAFPIYSLLKDQKIAASIGVIVWTVYLLEYPILSMVFLDSGVSFFLLLTLAFTKEYHMTRSNKYLYLAAICSGLAALSKIFGISAGIYFLIFLTYEHFSPKRTPIFSKVILGSILISAVSTLVWILYGVARAPILFIALQTVNADKSIFSPHNIDLAILVATPRFLPTQIAVGFMDPLLIVGWIAMAYLFSKRTFLLAQLAFLSYLEFSLAVGYIWFYGVVPLFPFFAIAIAVLLTDIIRLVSKQINRIGKISS